MKKPERTSVNKGYNLAIDDYEKFLPDRVQIQRLINALKPEFLAEAIAKRIGKE